MTQNEIEAWINLRNDRNNKLKQCDWTILPDSPLNPIKKAAWGVYRQELRDLPNKTLDLNNITWPKAP